jgi:hypothetical protein
VFPVRPELNVYVPSRRYSVSIRLTLETTTVKQESKETFVDYLMFILTVPWGRIPWYLGSKRAHSISPGHYMREWSTGGMIIGRGNPNYSEKNVS